MLPKYHILLGFTLSILLYSFSLITLPQATLIFLSSFLIDIDHYLFYVKKKKDYNLKNAVIWFKETLFLKKHKPMLVVFHTIEFIVLIAILSLYFKALIFILIGLLFHSITDLFYFIYLGFFNVREYSLIRYLVSNKNNYYH